MSFLGVKRANKPYAMKNLQLLGFCALITVASLSCKKNTPSNLNTVKDSDGNVYKTVTIGNQTWMAENLRTTKYRNGEPIQPIADPNAWAVLNSGAYRPADSGYGNYYNWYAVSDPRNIAPEGWHVATDADYTELATFLGGNAVAGGKLKEAGTSHWAAPNTGATNESGFTALAANQIRSDGYPWSIPFRRFFVVWTSSLFPGSSNPALYCLNFDDTIFSKFDSKGFAGNNLLEPKRQGCSVRCVKD